MPTNKKNACGIIVKKTKSSFRTEEDGAANERFSPAEVKHRKNRHEGPVLLQEATRGLAQLHLSSAPAGVGPELMYGRAKGVDPV